jgi:UDP-GlcNAc:undecaprenyl-phosphate/decaprenyl-phosphate GlcNAc-1-phosphate transferase
MTLTLRILITMLAGFIVNAGLTPLIIYLAHRNRWYDELNHRKIHTENIPRLGGFGIFMGMLISAAVAFAVSTGQPGLPTGLSSDTTGIAGFWQLVVYFSPVIGGMIIIHLVGLIDDFRNLRALLKLIIQVVAAVIVTLGPFRIERITVPFIWYNLELGAFAFPVTVVWIVAVSNAVNFIDGIDGLAGGSSAIAALFFAVIALLVGQGVSALLAIGIFGSLIAFLMFNSPPARIFMGDSGSYVLGFALGVFPLILADGTGNSLDMFPAITLLAIPILDMASSVLRRMRRGKHPFSADREHIHHRLMDRGLGTWRILAVIYGTCIVLGVTAVSWYMLPKDLDMAITLAVWSVCIALVLWLTWSGRKRED